MPGKGKKLSDYERARLYHDAMTQSFKLTGELVVFMQRIINAKVLPEQWERKAAAIVINGSTKATGIALALGLAAGEKE